MFTYYDLRTLHFSRKSNEIIILDKEFNTAGSPIFTIYLINIYTYHLQKVLLLLDI